MMRIVSAVLFLLLVNCSAVQAQEWNTNIPAEALIIKSTKSYPEALRTAREAASRLHKKLDLEGYGPHRTEGLTMSEKEAAENGYDYPAYIARGNGMLEAMDFISIEYSDAYEGMAKGYYIVMAAIAKPGSSMVKESLKDVRTAYKDAYVKRTMVFFGCMH